MQKDADKREPEGNGEGATRESGVPGRGHFGIEPLNGDGDTRESGDPGREARGWFGRGYIPHFDGGTTPQHVTIHQADSLPKEAIEMIEQELKRFPKERVAVEKRKRLHEWIDAGYGSCLLRNPMCAHIVQNALLHFHEVRYKLHAWVVMPNHIHVLFSPMEGYAMQDIVTSWKKFTGRKIGDWLKENRDVDFASRDSVIKDATQESGVPGKRTPGKGIPGGRLWHREYWDRYIRNEGHFLQTVEYIHCNPVKAGLVSKACLWPWSSIKKAMSPEG